MTTTIKLKTIRWGDGFQTFYQTDKPVYPNVDGAIEYIIKLENGLEMIHWQPFSAKGMSQTKDGKNVWAWDGNKEEPTLTPSFLVDCPNTFRIHLFFTKGKINLLGDSTVTLEV